MPASSARERKSLLPAAEEVIENGTEAEDKRTKSNSRLTETEEYAVERIVRHLRLQ